MLWTRRCALLTVAFWLSQEARLWSISSSAHWVDVFGRPFQEVSETGPGDIRWAAIQGGGSGGVTYEISILADGVRLNWATCFHLGEHFCKIDRSAGSPRFLVYQPWLDANSNHIYQDHPELLIPGFWLLEKSSRGYRRRPVLTNRLCLGLRNPLGVLESLPTF